MASAIDCVRFHSGGEFLHELESMLEARDPETNLILSNGYRLRDIPPTQNTPSYLASVKQGEIPRLAAIMAYRLPLCVYPLEWEDEGVLGPAIDLLVEDILLWRCVERRAMKEDLSLGATPDERTEQSYRGSITKLVAPKTVAKLFMNAWEKKSGKPARHGMHMRLYSLTHVNPEYLGATSGELKVADESDRDVVAKWHWSMDREALSGEIDMLGAELLADMKIKQGQVFLWVSNGEPVAMACRTRATKRGIVLNTVYTPPEHRRQGYGSNCVAAVSQRLLNDGYEFCSLFTDLSNPISNSIYQKVGYRPLADFDECHLG